MSAKILTIDVETAPTLAYTWGLWDQSIGLNQIVEPTYILSWAAKWLGKKEIIFGGINKHTKGKCSAKYEAVMIKGMWELLDEADIVVGHNSNAFDLKHLNSAFIRAKMPPPSSYRKIDTLKIAKANMKFISNKLEHLTYTLGLEHKMHHEGFELWTKCMAGDPKAWRIMEKYNKKDVGITEQLYMELRAYMPNHPNLQIYSPMTDPGCPLCGSHERLNKGYYYTNLSRFRRWKCIGVTDGRLCGKNYRGRENTLSKSKSEFIGANTL